MGNIDLDRWLAEREINPKWVREIVVPTVRKEYPALTAALRNHKDVTAELELVKLIRDIENRQFYLSRPT